MTSRKSTHGGKRAGSGRKRIPPHMWGLKKVSISVSLPMWIARRLDELNISRSQAVIDALINYYKLVYRSKHDKDNK